MNKGAFTILIIFSVFFFGTGYSAGIRTKISQQDAARIAVEALQIFSQDLQPCKSTPPPRDKPSIEITP